MWQIKYIQIFGLTLSTGNAVQFYVSFFHRSKLFHWFKMTPKRKKIEKVVILQRISRRKTQNWKRCSEKLIYRKRKETEWTCSKILLYSRKQRQNNSVKTRDEVNKDLTFKQGNWVVWNTSYVVSSHSCFVKLTMWKSYDLGIVFLWCFAVWDNSKC